jgi:hypothetical protein
VTSWFLGGGFSGAKICHFFEFIFESGWDCSRGRCLSRRDLIDLFGSQVAGSGYQVFD